MPHVSPFSRGMIFTCARVSLALLSLRENGDYSCSRNQKISTKTKVGTILDCISFQISFTIVYRRPSKIVRANKKLNTKPCAQIRVFHLSVTKMSHLKIEYTVSRPFPAVTTLLVRVFIDPPGVLR